MTGSGKERPLLGTNAHSVIPVKNPGSWHCRWVQRSSLFKYCPTRTGHDPVKASSIGLVHPEILLSGTGQSSCYFLFPNCCCSFLLEKGYCLPQGLHQRLPPCGIHRGGLHLENWISQISALSVKVPNFLVLQRKHNQFLVWVWAESLLRHWAASTVVSSFINQL